VVSVRGLGVLGVSGVALASAAGVGGWSTLGDLSELDPNYFLLARNDSPW
jgi:hypothetical protein